MTHWLIHDYRRFPTQEMIKNFNNIIETFIANAFDGISLSEDLEPIYGLCFICMQNYIVGTINDFQKIGFLNTEFKKHEWYGLNDDGKREIELIIHLANYAKHKDEGLNINTKSGLESFGLYVEEDDDIVDSPLFKGASLLDENQSFNNIVIYVLEWREKLYAELEKSN